MRLQASLRRLGTRRGLPLVISAAVGAGGGALAIAFSPGLAGVARSTPVSPLRKVSLADNKQPLSQPEVAALVAWARKYRACALQRGLALHRPAVGQDEVVLKSSSGPRIEQTEFMRAFPCGEELGGPPRFTSFVLTRAGSLHLYRPRACLLPVKKEKV